MMFDRRDVIKAALSTLFLPLVSRNKGLVTPTASGSETVYLETGADNAVILQSAINGASGHLIVIVGDGVEINESIYIDDGITLEFRGRPIGYWNSTNDLFVVRGGDRALFRDLHTIGRGRSAVQVESTAELEELEIAGCTISHSIKVYGGVSRRLAVRYNVFWQQNNSLTPLFAIHRPSGNIETLEFVGNRMNGGGGDKQAVTFGLNIHYAILENNVIENYSLDAFDLDGGHRVVVRGNIVRNCRYAYGVKAMENVVFVGNMAVECERGINWAVPSPCVGNTVIDCELGMYVSDEIGGARIVGCQFVGSTGHHLRAVKMLHGAITNCRFDDTNGHALWIDEAQHLLISENHFSGWDHAEAAIWLRKDVDEARIIHNSFVNEGGYALEAEGGVDVDMRDNWTVGLDGEVK